MCGISGLLGTEGLSDARSIVGKMNEALSHRGPDASGIYTNGELVLGHRRLSIIDLSDAGNQPFVSEDERFAIVYNGELYNYIELRNELKDQPFRTQTDTEVILNAWRAWGPSCLNRFNGMFAFAIWDSAAETLYIARDRMGIKPLYYARHKHHLIFASELRAVLASGLIPAHLNRDALVDYLRYQTVHSPDTLVSGIHSLPSGHYLKVQDNDFKVVCWWDITRNYDRSAGGKDAAVLKRDIRETLSDSVNLRMRADVPFGAFLSGGIDSSIVVGLMSEVAREKVRTFTVTFDEKEFSEAEFAASVAKRFGTEHTDIRLKADDFLDLLPSALNAMDHPSGDGPNTFVVSQVTKAAGVTMALSGLGGDELFAGYPVFKQYAQLMEKTWVMSFPPHLRRIGTGLLRKVRPGVASEKIAEILDQDYLDLEHAYPVSRMVLLDHRIKKLTGREALPENAVRKLMRTGVAYGNPGFDLPFLSKISFGEMFGYMQHTLLRDTDQMSMAHALEVRVPFLDHRLVELVYGINDAVKYPYTPKKLLVESMAGLLPEEVVHRPKMGFTLPWEIWMKGALKTYCEERIHRLGERESFQSKELKSLWQSFLNGDKNVSWSRVWPLVVLEQWIETNGIKD